MRLSPLGSRRRSRAQRVCVVLVVGLRRGRDCLAPAESCVSRSSLRREGCSPPYRSVCFDGAVRFYVRWGRIPADPVAGYAGGKAVGRAETTRTATTTTTTITTTRTLTRARSATSAERWGTLGQRLSEQEQRRASRRRVERELSAARRHDWVRARSCGRRASRACGFEKESLIKIKGISSDLSHIFFGVDKCGQVWTSVDK